MQNGYVCFGMAECCILCTSLQCVLDDVLVFRKMQHVLCANPATQTLTHRVCCGCIFSLCGMMYTLVHAHTLNLCRSKREDKLLNPAAAKLTTCAGTTKAGVTVFQKSAGHWHPHLVLQETPCCSLGAWRMLPWKQAILCALSLSPERTGSSLVTSPFVMEMGLIQ